MCTILCITRTNKYIHYTHNYNIIVYMYKDILEERKLIKPLCQHVPFDPPICKMSF